MQTRTRSRAFQTFLYALFVSALIFLPFVLRGGGYFLYYGDFNVQQIPFYKLAHEAVRSGDIFWSFHTDLGANFIGSYSFYLLFSPFFWLTLPFPTAWVPYLMAPLLVLKTACAALTAHFYLRRFVKDERYAGIGALLYAFSGWMSFNIFFNHFHEVAVFFPLLLLGVEKLVTENKRGLLAVSVMINAVVNYWFFVGEVVFVILYVILRATDRSWGFSLKKFCLVAWESLLGVGCAAAAMLPSVLALTGNPRTGADELLSGWRIWLYWHEQRQPAIVQSLFFPPELPARPNFLPDHGAKWASLSGWLPLFSMTGVLAYYFRRRSDWLKRMLTLCFIFSLVPALNSLFILLNNSYYARWFYMPILLMALATARSLEDSAESTRDFSRAVRWTGLIVLIFTLMCGLTPMQEDGAWRIGLASDRVQMWIYVGIAALCSLMTAVIVLRFRYSKRFLALVTAGVLTVSLGFSAFYLASGKHGLEQDQWMVEHVIEGREKVSLPDEDYFSRVDFFEATDNLGMYWHRPTIQAFHSIVPPSLMEFYPAVGVKRDVGSRPEEKFYALRPLLSVRWLFIRNDNEEQEPMPGYAFAGEQNDFYYYENVNFLPMGFTYDSYVTTETMEKVEKDLRSNLMLRAVVLSETAALRNADLLAPLAGERFADLSVDAMADDVAARRRYTADSFETDRRGFTARTSFDSPQLLFFSVPYEAGWSARILGGEDLIIEKANVGFMAVRVPAGPQTIRFDYKTPGLFLGLLITAGSVLVLLLYLLIARRLRVDVPEPPDPVEALRQGQTAHFTLEQYDRIYGDRKARAAHLQQVLNEAAVRYMQSHLSEEEKTLRFDPEAPAPPSPTNPEHNPEKDGNTEDSHTARGETRGKE